MPPPPSAIEVLPETDTSTFTVPDRLTLQSIAKRRAASGKLIAGVAAAADFETYKGRTQHVHKTKAKRWEDRMTEEAKARTGSSLKNAAKFLKTEGLISLGGGLPSSEYFPVEEMGFTVPCFGRADAKDGVVNGVGNGGGNGILFPGDGKVLTAGKNDMSDGTSDFDIATAFQYGQGHGSAQLLRWIIEHTELVHDPPYSDWSSTMTIGSTSALDVTLRMFSRPGDWILSEQYTFPAMVETAAPMGVRVAGVGMDENGMLASSLEEVLCNWDEDVRSSKRPFLLYTVPTGQNPTGSTQTLQRRKEIYAVAERYDLLIIEDEPYYFLQMPPYTPPTTTTSSSSSSSSSTPTSSTTSSHPPDPPTTHADFLHTLIPSYLSLDTSGRVLRLDTFSKTIAPGMRVGWITAPEHICARYHTHADLSTQSPSGVSQLLLFKLLEEHWGHAGYLDWLMHLRQEYTRRRDVILAACEQFLPREVVGWEVPKAGMFLWLKVDVTRHPDYRSKTAEVIEDELFRKSIEFKALLLKGSWFLGEKKKVDGKGVGQEEGVLFFRATYAAAPFEQIREAVRRFGLAVREEFGIARLENGTA